MLTSNFQITSGASLPALEVVVTKDGRISLYTEAVPQGCPQEHRDPNVVDLSSVWNITFALYKAEREAVRICNSGTARVVDKKNGVVEYQWSPQDTSEPGLYYGQFIITFSDNTVLKFPLQLESLSVEVSEGGVNQSPVRACRKETIQIIQGYQKVFTVSLPSVNNGNVVNLLGVTEIVASFPQATGPDPIQETYTGGNIAVLNPYFGVIQITIPGSDALLMNPSGMCPLQNLQISVTIGSNPPMAYTFEQLLNIITAAS